MNSNHNELSSNDQKNIGHLLAAMNHYALYRPLMHQTILQRLIHICEVSGPSSILRVANFDQTNARLIGKPVHINLSALEGIAVKAWEHELKSGKNPIFKSMLEQHRDSGQMVNFATGEELLERINYYDNKALKSKLFDALRKNVNIGELGYLWLVLQSNFALIVCLRRRKHDGDFTQYHRNLLQQFGFAALGSQSSWHIPPFDILDTTCDIFKDKLTDRQFETLHRLGQYYSRKECAKLMNVSNATVDRNVENLLTIFRDHFNEFSGKPISHIIGALKNKTHLFHFTP